MMALLRLGRDCKVQEDAVFHFLLNYHSSIHECTGKMPSELHLGRRLKSRLECGLRKVLRVESTRAESALKKEERENLDS